MNQTQKHAVREAARGLAIRTAESVIESGYAVPVIVALLESLAEAEQTETVRLALVRALSGPTAAMTAQALTDLNA